MALAPPAFVVDYVGELSPDKIGRWGQRLCTELALGSQGQKKVLLGIWKDPSEATAPVVRGRLRSNLRTWNVAAASSEGLRLVDVETYRAELSSLGDVTDVLLLDAPSRKRARVTVSQFATGAASAATGEAAPPSAAQDLFVFDPAKKMLVVGGEPARVFEDAEGNPWFQAKPIIVFLEYGETHVQQTLQRLDPEDVAALEKLLPNISGQFTQNFGHNDLKALYVNEPGVYDLILGSEKREARAFKRWVTHDVLPAIRRRGGADQRELAAELRSSLAAQFDEIGRQLAQLGARPPAERMQLNLNVTSSRRPDGDASRLNTTLATPEEMTEIRRGALPVTVYLKERLPNRDDRRRALVPFSTRLRDLKLAQCEAAGAAPRYVGQLDRAQLLYLQEDRVLMDRAFAQVFGGDRQDIRRFFR